MEIPALTKLDLLDCCMEQLYKSMEQDVQDQLLKLAIKHSQVTQNQQSCFKYKGEFYIPKALEPILHIYQCQPLIENLHSDMEDYLVYKYNSEKLMRSAQTFIRTCLNQDKDILVSSQFLPDVLCKYIKPIEHLVSVAKESTFIDTTIVDDFHRTHDAENKDLKNAVIMHLL